jgi:hypothetical protein
MVGQHARSGVVAGARRDSFLVSGKLSSVPLQTSGSLVPVVSVLLGEAFMPRFTQWRIKRGPTGHHYVEFGCRFCLACAATAAGGEGAGAATGAGL